MAHSWTWACYVKGGAVALILATGNAQAPASPQPEFHRMNVPAGVARATKGHFAVRMPIPFNDATGRIEDRNIGPLVMHFITGQSEDGFELGAQEAEWTPRMKNPDVRAILTSLARPDTANDPIIEVKRDGERDDGQAIFETPDRSTYVRVVKTPRAIFTLTCDFPSQQRAVADRLCADFLRSFVEIGPRAAPTP